MELEKRSLFERKQVKLLSRYFTTVKLYCEKYEVSAWIKWIKWKYLIECWTVLECPFFLEYRISSVFKVFFCYLLTSKEDK